MDFSKALKVLKDGFLITRNGITIGLQKGYPDGIGCNKNTSDLFNIAEGNPVIIRPYFQRINTDGSLSNYTPTTDDILATDWGIVHYQEEEYQNYYRINEKVENLTNGITKIIKNMGLKL